jgi:hypothetical protein
MHPLHDHDDTRQCLVVAARKPGGTVPFDDSRPGCGRHALAGLFRQSVFGRLAGYEGVNDAERLRHDPEMRIVGGKATLGSAASPSQMGRFETRWLTAQDNLSTLADLSGKWIDRLHARRPPRGILLDMDSSVSPTHGEQENSVWNGHYACTCYHPLFLFNQFGDCALRPDNVHRSRQDLAHLRADAGFANPEVYEFLEVERTKYAIRLPTNRGLQERIGYLLKRPVGRPSNDVRRSYASFTYQAGSWSRPRQVIAKVEWHPGELYPRVGFIVTNMSRPAKNVVAFYNKRGTCEQWIKEGKGAINWTRLSCRSFAANAVRLQLHALAYNLGNFLRTLAMPEPIKDWPLTTLKARRGQPWVRVTKQYLFDGPEGKQTLGQLFNVHSQLIVYHSCSVPIGRPVVKAARFGPTILTALCRI